MYMQEAEERKRAEREQETQREHKSSVVELSDVKAQSTTAAAGMTEAATEEPTSGCTSADETSLGLADSRQGLCASNI